VSSLPCAAHSVTVGCCKARASCSIVYKTGRVDLKRVFWGIVDEIFIRYLDLLLNYGTARAYIFGSEVQAILGGYNGKGSQ